jgi:hypothetical protein
VSEFKRENRYIVIKIRDLDAYASHLKAALSKITNEIEILCGNREYVVVESDWPEYEIVWKMMQDRVEGNAQPAAEVKVSNLQVSVADHAYQHAIDHGHNHMFGLRAALEAALTAE